MGRDVLGWTNYGVANKKYTVAIGYELTTAIFFDLVRGRGLAVGIGNSEQEVSSGPCMEDQENKESKGVYRKTGRGGRLSGCGLRLCRGGSDHG